MRILAYAAAATSAFAVAAGVGAAATLIMQGATSSPTSERPQAPQEQAPQEEEQGGDARQDEARQGDARHYLGEVGDIQAKAVHTLLDSHDKLLRYDALTAEDVEELRANYSALQGLTDRVDDLGAPQGYEEHYEVFRQAIEESREATRLAYGLAADPVGASESGFEGYDARLDEADALLERSNELVGRDYETLGGVQEISPQL